MAGVNLIQIKRGPEASRTNYTPRSGEMLWTTDGNKLFVGDGATAGGIDILSSVTSLLGTAATYNVGTTAGTIPVIGANGKLDTTIIPALAYTETYVVADEAAMLALSAAEAGDVAVRTDINQSFIMSGLNPAQLSDWTMLLTPTDTVLSVNGKTGAVTLTKDDIGLSNVENYSVAMILDNAALTGTPTAPTAVAESNGTAIANTAWVTTHVAAAVTGLTTYVDTEIAELKAYADLNFMVISQDIDAGTWA